MAIRVSGPFWQTRASPPKITTAHIKREESEELEKLFKIKYLNCWGCTTQNIPFLALYIFSIESLLVSLVLHLCITRFLTMPGAMFEKIKDTMINVSEPNLVMK